MTTSKKNRKQPEKVEMPEPPKVSRDAMAAENKIVTILKKLVKQTPSSCLDKSFRTPFEKVLSLFEAYQGAVLKEYPLPLTCSAGCGICCYHWPEDTYSFEVRYIADYLKNHRAEELGTIITRLREDVLCLKRIKKTVTESMKIPKNKADLGERDPYDLVLSSFYQFKRPCALLSKDGSCSIYPIRPFTCRVYISFSHKDYCKPSKIGSDKALTYLLDLEQDSSDLFDRLHFMYDTFDGDTSFRSMLLTELTKV